MQVAPVVANGQGGVVSRESAGPPSTLSFTGRSYLWYKTLYALSCFIKDMQCREMIRVIVITFLYYIIHTGWTSSGGMHHSISPPSWSFPNQTRTRFE